MEIKIVNYSRGPIEINKELWLNAGDSEFDLAVRTHLKYSVDSDLVGFQVDLNLVKTAERTPVMNIGLLIGLRINGFNELIAIDSEKESNMVEICRYVWPMVIGAVAASSAIDCDKPLVLPTVDTSKLAREVILHKTEE